MGTTDDLHRRTVEALGVAGELAHLMTAEHGGERAGVVVNSVQVCAHEPLLVCVSVRKGHSIEPLIRDSHAFALCRIDEADRLLLVKFDDDEAPDERGDPFESIGIERLRTGSPVIGRCAHVLDCEVVRHFDLEADCELYIGEVVAARNGRGS